MVFKMINILVYCIVPDADAPFNNISVESTGKEFIVVNLQMCEEKCINPRYSGTIIPYCPKSDKLGSSMEKCVQ